MALVQYKTGAFMQDKRLQNDKFIICAGFSRGMLAVDADVVDADILPSGDAIARASEEPLGRFA